MGRIIGTETEYGIATPSDPLVSPIVTSTHVVVALSRGRGVRWDYGYEHPLRDSRGFDLRRYHQVPEVSSSAVGAANMVVENGGRFYVDHAHPEYSSPECSSPLEAALYDAAGDVIVRQGVAAVAALTAVGQSAVANYPPCPPLKIYKNNVDGKGASYGSHENYLYSRSTDFSVLAQALIPFFVARQVIVGAGRVGVGALGEQPGFQISQRADYIEQEISLETTLNRGIINTRDEPHADADRFGRLHVIIGDATMSHYSTVLKLGMTSLVLDAIEAGVDFSDVQLANAVAEVSAVSRDVNLTHALTLVDGRRLTALELLELYHRRVSPDEVVHPLWGDVMARLRSGGAAACADTLDWCAKWALISGYRARGKNMSDPTMQLVDLQYGDVDQDRGLYYALVKKGRMRTLFSEEEIEYAAQHPPRDTRAFFRGEVVRHLPDRVDAASWESISVAGKRIVMVEADGFSQAVAGDVVALLPDSSAFMSALEQKGWVE